MATIWPVPGGGGSGGASPAIFSYAVVAGGGGAAGGTRPGGSGAGGFRSSYPGLNSGGGYPQPENTLALDAGSYTVTVGAGGGSGANGGDSVFASVISLGGGAQISSGNGRVGGSGSGGSNFERVGASGTAGQGYAGYRAFVNVHGDWYGGAGGGARGNGNQFTGGAGVTTTLLEGVSVEYARGGNYNAGTGGPANTGGARSSGIVSLLVQTGRVTDIGPGLTYTSTVIDGDTRYVFTAGTDTITVG